MPQPLVDAFARTAVIGARGMLGREVTRQLAAAAPNGRFRGLDLPELDITSPAALRAHTALQACTVIINCSGYTDVERAEQEEELALRVNRDGVANLARLARSRGALLIHVSTDFVFDGKRRTPYPVDAHPRPLGAYGRSKLAGEQALAASGCDFCLVRTAWLFGPAKRNFVTTMLERARQGQELAVVADQHGSPTFTVDLARVLLTLAARRATGTFHCANAGSCTWHDLAGEALRLAGRPTRIIPIDTAEAARRFKLKAKRPAYSVLDCSSLQGITGGAMRSWRAALAEYVAGLRVQT